MSIKFSTPIQLVNLGIWDLEKKINYSFKNKIYLSTALTHSSESKNNNERLEYLGDAVINLAISDYLIKNFTDLDEGSLSILRSNLVSRATLSKVASQLGLEIYLKIGKSLLNQENKKNIEFLIANEGSLKNELIFTSHKLQTGNAISTYETYGRLFEQFDVFNELSKLISEKVNMPFMDMWANINPPGTNVRPHNHYSPNHPNSLVGVYYLRKPTNSGNLIIEGEVIDIQEDDCLLYTSPSPRDRTRSRMPSSA